MNPKVLRELADRCEREESSWRLSVDIGLAIAPADAIDRRGWDRRVAIGIGAYAYNPPPYVSSLDAAATLVPEGCSWEGAFGERTTHAEVHSAEIYDAIGESSGAWTPALALCAAALRARAAIAEQTEASKQSGEAHP